MSIEKDNRKLEAENRALRCKNSDLSSEQRRLLREKESIQRDIKRLLDGKENAVDEKRVAENELKSVTEKIKKEILDIAKQRAELDQKEESINDTILNLSKQKSALAKDQSMLEDRERSLKNERAKVSARESRVIEKEALVMGIEEEANNAKESYKRAELDIMKQRDELGKKLAQASDTIDRAREVKMLADERLKSVEKTILMIKNDQNDLLKKRNEIDEIIEATVEVSKELNDKSDGLKAREKAIDAMLSSMATREKELKIKELRIEKLAKDKGIAEELKALEAELGA